MSSPGVWGLVAVVAAVLALVALALTLRVHRSVRAMQRRQRAVLLGDDADASAALLGLSEALAAERARVSTLEETLSTVRSGLEQSLQHVAVVRYDAFGDMGGRMSFSAAIVDDRGDGMVFSSIHARSESRTYAKGVVDGRSDVTLSPEERHALDAARSGRAE
ncbi:MAG TPA: DUF4446 family protein [Ornithinimicrobium sp.]|uniref:DUF4446 family protein n=1 Tax=Ornithinimicrobium sp. TaxID=1977084 RepID=UPI002B45BF3E|nr:DUF4446 family protein [Ornithinimicrobium sp.]HKJ11465.1 DUF4446 family protein [Ornithinimicrobium sp.]